MLENKILKIDPNNPDPEKLAPAVEVLKKGGVIVYPTETVYGLGADIYHKKAVEKIYKIKARDLDKPVSCMISSKEEVTSLCEEIPEYAETLMQAYWPGPLTLIFRAKAGIPTYIQSIDNKIGLRFPEHAICTTLMHLQRQPVTSTSANLAGHRAAATVEELDEKIKAAVDLIIDGGKCEKQVPSTVVDVTGAKPVLVREGTLAFSQIVKRLQEGSMESKKFRVLFVCSGNSCRSPMAEGLLQAKLPDELKEKVDVQSAGTLGINGNPATEFAMLVTKELGGDISGHRSQGVTEELVKASDIIFAMAPEHKEFLQDRFPEARENVFLLRSFDRKPEEKHLDRIEDPIGSPLEVYQECGLLINSELERIFPRLDQMIENKLREEEGD